MHTIRELEAFRVVLESDVILKDKVPPLGEIVKVRMEKLLENADVAVVKDQNAYEIMGKKLLRVLQKMYGSYDEMLLELTHYNIFTSMRLLARIITNKRYFGSNEKEEKGAFVINPEDYPVYNNASVFFSLVYGEKDYYVDHDNYYLTNILHYRRKGNVDAERLGIYVIQYLINNKKFAACLNYEISTLTSDMVIDDLMSVFDYMPPEKSERYREAFNYTMKFLYEGGVLLQSLKEPIYEDGDDFKREYKPEIKIYLSLRGRRLYEMLMANSLLLEAYRDDIDTDLDKNDILTRQLPDKIDVFESCLEYAEHVFTLDQQLFMYCSDPEAAVEKIGSKLACVVLMKGLGESIQTYKLSNDEKNKLVRIYNALAQFINRFIREFMDTDDKGIYDSVKLLNTKS